jgi:hypothetical protein
VPPPHPGGPKRRWRWRLVLATIAAITVGAVGVSALVDNDPSPPPPSATGAPATNVPDASIDEMVTELCGPLGLIDYMEQAYCLLDAVGLGRNDTDTQALSTIARDACTHPDIDAMDLAHRIAPVTRETAWPMALTELTGVAWTP